MGDVIQFRPIEAHSEAYYGACPRCGSHDGYVSVGRDHYWFCEAHMLYWHIGSNLFENWRDETEEQWEQNRQFLAGLNEATPIYPPGFGRA